MSITAGAHPTFSDVERPRGMRLGEWLLVGGVTLFLFPLAWHARRAFGLDEGELTVGFLAFHAAYVINDPHFSVTYLLFYRDATKRLLDRDVATATRIRYAFAGAVVPIALAAWAAIGLGTRSAQTIGWMVQLMFLLVGWHYVKQGFGVLVLLLGRRGSFLSAGERRIVLLHCYAGWAFAWANPAAPAGDFEEKGLVYSALAHPRWLELGCGAVLAASSIALVAVLAAKRLREGAAFPLSPVVVFLVTVWSWTIYSSIDPLVRYVIPALHSIQYLYVVWSMKRNEARAQEGPPHFGRPVAVRLGVLALSALGLGWLSFHFVPTFLDTAFVPRPADDAAGPLGATPFTCAIYVFLNVHHYFMDAVIWRRDNPATRWLRA